MKLAACAAVAFVPLEARMIRVVWLLSVPPESSCAIPLHESGKLTVAVCKLPLLAG